MGPPERRSQRGLWKMLTVHIDQWHPLEPPSSPLQRSWSGQGALSGGNVPIVHIAAEPARQACRERRRWSPTSQA